ncbi:hypothetical protein KA093_01725 [Candidatus Saccharibacteria bacterium]|nr:hypothetical protein [Candidatus Saccharibacteria bacterium]
MSETQTFHPETEQTTRIIDGVEVHGYTPADPSKLSRRRLDDGSPVAVMGEGIDTDGNPVTHVISMEVGDAQSVVRSESLRPFKVEQADNAPQSIERRTTAPPEVLEMGNGALVLAEIHAPVVNKPTRITVIDPHSNAPQRTMWASR